jgi:hypothetical protein
VGHKRKLTSHQRQIRFILILFGTIMVVAVVGLILLLNRPVGGYQWGPQ